MLKKNKAVMKQSSFRKAPVLWEFRVGNCPVLPGRQKWLALKDAL